MTASKHQQTVERAIDTETNRRYEASELLSMSEQEFSSLRRAAMANRVARQKDAASPRFVCAACKNPLYLSRYIRDDGNRWFAHDGASLECPWYEGNKLSPDQRRALIYRGEQEGTEHRRIKNFLTTWLMKEPGVSDVNPEMVTHGQILQGEWKRPDTQCVRRGQRIVFEIQLSYTFLSDVIKRDEFYRNEGIFIIWVFNTIDLRRAVVRDEIFFNRRNLFAIDATSLKETESRGRLTFTGHFHKPTLLGRTIEDEWDSRLITLDDVHFPVPEYRPYFFDYDSAKRDLEVSLADTQRKATQAAREAQQARLRAEQAVFQAKVQCYLSAALAFYDSDYARHREQSLLDAARALEEHQLWHRGYEVLSAPNFYGWHCVLPVLLSIKHNRAVGYGVDSAYRVLEAGLRHTTQGERLGLAVLYLWACKAYKPTLNAKQRTWVGAQAAKIKASLEANEPKYLRFMAYDEAVGLLFPELEPKLVTPYATPYPRDAADR